MSRRGFTGIDLDLLADVLPGPIASGDGLAFNGRAVPVRGGIVRFREDDGYNGSFALQRRRFKTNQIDAINGTRLSLWRFAETGWPEADLAGKLVLEAGCGAGRFTRLLAEAGARLVTFDYSGAIDICRENNGRFSNVVFLQCDIFDMPFRPGAFDYVFCHGVLQHTPDPKAAFMALARHVAPGGRISIDIYRKDGLVRPWKSKYLWRPLTRRMRPERLLAFLEWFIPKWLPIDTAIKRIPRLGNYLGAVIPCWNYYFTDLPPEQKRAWAVMDTFDALAPLYDNPVRLEEVRAWFEELGWPGAEVRPGGNGVVGNARRPGAADEAPLQPTGAGPET
jgi:SAM-dependent methyltransferase